MRFVMETGRIIRISILIAVIAVSVLLFAGGIIFPGQQEDNRTPEELASVTETIQKRLDTISDLVENASNRLSTGIEEDEAQEVLDNAYNATPDAVFFYTFTPDGIISVIYPEQYNEEFSGIRLSDISNSSGIWMSGSFMTEITEYDGDYVFEIVSPVYGGDGEIIGGVVATINSFKLLNEIVAPAEETSSSTFTVMQTDGLIIYDADERQVGANLFTSDVFSNFPNLRNLGVKFTTTSSGYGSYMYYPTGSSGDGKPVKKLAYWDSAGLYGTEWRVIMFREALS